jgi:hypothetical protein
MKTSFRFLTILTSLVILYQAAAQNFTLTSSPEVGDNPHCIIAADINGDGNVDLICANAGAVINPGNTLSVLTNNGSGGFGSNVNYTVGSAPYSVTAADVNGDGKLDLISANHYDKTLSVLTNNGSGGFGSNATYTVGNYPSSVVAADVNGDGHIDLICANSTDNTLLVLTNNGSGSFGSNATYAVGYIPISVVAADVNHDGYIDLICANSRGSSLSVLTNDRSGGFVLASTLATPQPNSVAAADVNGDGYVDLICANTGYGTLTVFTNNGNGGFALASTNDVGFQPQSVVATDVNGDGHVDLVCADLGIYELPGNILINGNTLSVLTNDGGGGFVLASTPFLGVGPVSVTAADVNGDGKVDLISGNNGSTLSVLINVPKLNINPSSNIVNVSWPSSWTNWTLQQNSDLATTNWSTSSAIADDGTNKNLIITQPNGNLFFRLSHP